MTKPNRFCLFLLRRIEIASSTALLVATSLLALHPAQAQTFQLIHRFQNVDGAYPVAGLTIDAQGRLYGTTSQGGAHGLGSVFRLTHMGSGWVQDVLYSFGGGTDGYIPESRVIFGPDGTLFGTTVMGGDPSCDPPSSCGTVFNLQPPTTACKTPLCPWRKTIIHNFEGTLGGNDGENPSGDLAFDRDGNLYGTTHVGGQYNSGMVYKLTKVNGAWTESNLYSFTIFASSPSAGVTIDAAGNLYGTVPIAYTDCCMYYGAVYELSPSGGGWIEQIIHYFQQSDGAYPFAGLTLDAGGNLYGATSFYGANNGGTAFELSPSNGGWSFSVLYNFAGSSHYDPGPAANLVFDQSGNLYGTTFASGADQLGSVFKLSPGAGGWTYTSLYDFNDQYIAAYPISNVVFDSAGNLYGTTSQGGPYYYCSYGCGTVWEITP